LGVAEFNSAYIGTRSDIVSQVPKGAAVVLDVGCSVGALGANLMAHHSGTRVYGIELDAAMAKEAEKVLHNVLNLDMDNTSIVEQYGKEFFDCIIFADVLEHLKDPWKVIEDASRALKPGGVIITCLPNVRHMYTISSLLFKGVWPYRKRGIHDVTHLRFFTRKNIVAMFKGKDLEIQSMKSNYRIIESGSSVNRFAKYFALPLLKEFLVFQYITVARKT